MNLSALIDEGVGVSKCHGIVLAGRGYCSYLVAGIDVCFLRLCCVAN